MRTEPVTYKYFLQSAGRIIETTVTGCATAIDDWIRNAKGKIFSLEVGWINPRIGTTSLHLLSENQCLIIRFCHLPFIPSSLRTFCSDPRHVFVGADITDNMKSLRRYGLFFSNKVELRGVSGKRGLLKRVRLAKEEMQVVRALVGSCHGNNLIMIHRIEREWGERALDEILVQDAVVILHVCYRIGRTIVPSLG